MITVIRALLLRIWLGIITDTMSVKIYLSSLSLTLLVI